MTYRIAVFTNQYPSRVNTFFARDMRSLIDAGFEIDIFPLYPLDASLWRYVPDMLNERVLPRSRVHYLGGEDVLRSLAVVRPREMARFASDALAIGGSALGFGPAPLLKSAYAAAKAWAWMRAAGAHFDHVLAYWGNYAASAAYLFQRGMDPDVPFSTFLHAGTDLYRDQVFLKEKLLHAETIVMVCEFNRRFLRAQYGDEVIGRLEGKMHFHHLGLDLEDFRFHGGAKPAARILGVGSFEKVKGYEYLVTALREVRDRGIAAELELVGDGTQTAALKRLAFELGIAQAVRFRGWLTPDAVKAAMVRATVLVHPSTGLGDAVPTVIKEAMALGTPVIASNVVGIPELLDEGRCGVLVEPRSSQALASALSGLLTDEPRRLAIAALARRYAEQKFNQQVNGRALAARLSRAPMARCS